MTLEELVAEYALVYQELQLKRRVVEHAHEQLDAVQEKAKELQHCIANFHMGQPQ